MYVSSRNPLSSFTNYLLVNPFGTIPTYIVQPPCERCRDTRRNCTRGPHAACLTCVAGKTACSLVPPKTNTSKGPGSKDETPRRRVRVNNPKPGNASTDPAVAATAFSDMPAPPPPSLPVPMNISGPPTTPNGTNGAPPYPVPSSPAATWNMNNFAMDQNAYVTRGELMMWQSQIKSWVESRLAALTGQSPSTPTIHGINMGMNGAPSGGGSGAPPGQGMPMGPPGGHT
ncbi:hypothetical protein OF83DRAFT_748528 [Amylostereum chailletii]|nr:hypothetical protein OF83DRAFT_748528 [Amylostereum chailletii]